MLRFLRILPTRFAGLFAGLALVLAVFTSTPVLSAVSSDAQTTSGSSVNASIELPSESRYVVAKNGRAVRYELLQGQPGRPAYVTFNGLIYNQKYWDPFLKALNESGATIVRYSFSADPESLLKASKSSAKAFSVSGIGDEVEAVLNDAGLDRVVLLTLSFGSVGVEFAARHPERVERVVLMAPMILPNDAYDTAGSATRAYLENIRAFWGEAAYEFQWSLLMEPTVRTLVYKRVTTLPDYLPNGLSATTAVGGAIEKIKATRHFDLRDYFKVKLPRIDLMLAGEEEEPIFADQNDFWAKLPEAVKGNFVLVDGSAHALPATAPLATLKALEILEKADGGQSQPYVNLKMNSNGEVLSVIEGH